MKRRLHITIFLVFLSLGLSSVSILTSRSGIGEIYPFFYWKLYSQPLGWNRTAETPRIYAIKRDSLIKIKAGDYKGISRDEYLYLLGSMVKELKNNPDKIEEVKRKFTALASFIRPEYDGYALVIEKFNPYEIVKDSSAYDQEIIFKVH